jgi:hypothetical protein
MLRRMMFRSSTSLLGEVFIDATASPVSSQQCDEISTR